MTEDFIAKALTALRQKDFSAARNAIIAFAESNPLEFQHYLIKGLSELALEDWAAAHDTFAEAVKYFSHQPQIWLNLAIAQENLGLIDEAAESLEQSLDLKAEQGEAHGNLSNLYRKQGRFTEAEQMAHRAYELGMPKGQALNSLGLALSKQGKFEAAEKTFQEALRFDPDNVEILANMANLAIDQLNFAAAWPLFTAARAASDQPTIQRDEGMARLLANDYAQGWPLYESRINLPMALRIRPTCPRWNGQPLVGKKLLLIAEQGFGDTIMFCRYGKLLAELGAELFWIIQKPLQWLLSGNLPGTILTETDPLPDADYYLPLLSLPLATGTLTPEMAPSAPYLRVATMTELPKAEENMRKIGLVWTGSSTHGRDHERSIPLELFEPLFRGVTAQLYAPFIGASLDDITPTMPIIKLDNLIKDFADTAVLLQQLDCLITVDTAIAHLAGAMGIKTFLLLQHSPDWRWGASGTSTAWYPSLTLLRQPKYGDWGNVISALVEQLG